MHDIPKNRKTSTKESGHINGSNVALPRRHTAWIHWLFKFRQLVTCYPFSNADKNLEGIQPVASITHTTHGLRMSQLKKALALGHAQAETSVQHKRSAEKRTRKSGLPAAPISTRYSASNLWSANFTDPRSTPRRSQAFKKAVLECTLGHELLIAHLFRLR